MYPSISWLVKKLILLIVINDVVKHDKTTLLLIMCILYIANLILEHITVERYNELRLGGKAK